MPVASRAIVSVSPSVCVHWGMRRSEEKQRLSKHAQAILRVLRKGGFVKAARGKEGGYTLARPAGEIVIADVMDCLGGRLFESTFCESHAGQGKGSGACCERQRDLRAEGQPTVPRRCRDER